MSNIGQTSSANHRQSIDIINFKRGDIVWAKVRGYSWWPAKVGDVINADKRGDKENKYRVEFIGDNTHQNLPQNKVVDFVEFFLMHSNTKKRALLDSIELAKKQMKKEDLQVIKQQIILNEQKQNHLEKGASHEEVPHKNEPLIEKIQKLGSQRKQIAKGDKNDVEEVDEQVSPGKSQAKEAAASVNNGSSGKQSAVKKNSDQNEQIQAKESEKGQKENKRTVKMKEKELLKQKSGKLDEEEEEDEKDKKKKGLRSGSIAQTDKGVLGKRSSRKEIENLEEDKNQDDDSENEQMLDKSEDFEESKEEKRKDHQQEKTSLFKHRKSQPQEISKDNFSNEKVAEKKSPLKKIDEEDQEQKLHQLIQDENNLLKDGSRMERQERQKKKEAKKNIQHYINPSRAKKEDSPIQQKQLVMSKSKSHAQVIGNQAEGHVKNGNNMLHNSHTNNNKEHNPNKRDLNAQNNAHQKSNNGNTLKGANPTLSRQNSQHFRHASTEVQASSLNQLKNNKANANQQAKNQAEQKHLEVTKRFKRNGIQIKQIIDRQQEEELAVRLSLTNNQITQVESVDLIQKARQQSCNKMIKPEIAKINHMITEMHSSDVYIYNLYDSKVGKAIKYLLDFCSIYKQYLGDLEKIQKTTEMLCKKWKNYMLNCLFDESLDNKLKFDKNITSAQLKHYQEAQQEKHQLDPRHSFNSDSTNKFVQKRPSVEEPIMPNGDSPQQQNCGRKSLMAALAFIEIRDKQNQSYNEITEERTGRNQIQLEVQTCEEIRTFSNGSEEEQKMEDGFLDEGDQSEMVLDTQSNNRNLNASKTNQAVSQGSGDLGASEKQMGLQNQMRQRSFSPLKTIHA